MKITQVIVIYLLFIIAMALPTALAGPLGYTTVITNGFWLVFFYMSGLTFLVLMIMLLANRKSGEAFSQAFLGGTTLKIIACLIFLLIFLRKNNVNKAVFLGDFAYIYLLNTVFEVYILLRTLRLKNLR